MHYLRLGPNIKCIAALWNCAETLQFKLLNKMSRFFRNLSAIAVLAVGNVYGGPLSADKDFVGKAPVEEYSPLEIAVTGTWESRYVSEGRDNLDGAGMVSTAVDMSFDGLTLTAWYANSYDVAYSELDLVLEYAFDLGDDLESYLYYAHLRYPHDGNASENEIGTGLAYTALPLGLVPAVDCYYLAESDGTWIDCSLAYSIQVTDGIEVAPAVVCGCNGGYLGDGHNGANCIALTLPVTCAVTDKVELGAYASYQWDIDSDPVKHADDGSLGDFFWAGVAVTVSY